MPLDGRGSRAVTAGLSQRGEKFREPTWSWSVFSENVQRETGTQLEEAMLEEATYTVYRAGMQLQRPTKCTRRQQKGRVV